MLPYEDLPSQSFKICQSFCKFFDLYGQTVNLYINKKPKFYSTCSGIISIGIIFLITYTFTGFISSWLAKEKMVIIPSSVSYSVNELLSRNETDAYEFSYQNYYIYFTVYAYLSNGTELRNSQLLQYFTYNFSYWGTDHIPPPCI